MKRQWGSMKKLLILLLFSLCTAAFSEPLPERDRAAIAQAIREAVSPDAQITVQKADKGFARIEISLKDVTPATVYLKRDGGEWEVVAGPGTSFSPEELQEAGIPESVR